MNADLKRLGKRSAYRLGRLRVQGIAELAPPAPFRPSFARPRHRGPLSLWLLAWLAGAAVAALGALTGVWFLPFVAGLLGGLVNRFGRWRFRVLLPAAAAMAMAGWGIPLWWPALQRQPSGATARVIATLTGGGAHPDDEAAKSAAPPPASASTAGASRPPGQHIGGRADDVGRIAEPLEDVPHARGITVGGSTGRACLGEVAADLLDELGPAVGGQRAGRSAQALQAPGYYQVIVGIHVRTSVSQLQQ
jgi:hypothetical protein